MGRARAGEEQGVYLNKHAQISRAVTLVCKQAAKEDFCICTNLKATRISAEGEMTNGEPKDDTVITDPKETDKEATPSLTAEIAKHMVTNLQPLSEASMSKGKH